MVFVSVAFKTDTNTLNGYLGLKYHRSSEGTGECSTTHSGDRRPELRGDDAECMGRVSLVMKC